MTGDAPQPGETPHTEGNPWSFDPDAAWWRGDGDRERAEALAETAGRPRHPRRRPPPGGAPSAPAGTESAPAFAPEALDAHGAGVQDAATAMNPAAAAVQPDDLPVIQAGDASPALLGDATPAAGDDTSPAVQGDTSPAVQGDTSPAVQGDTSPAVQGDTSPAVQGDTSPAVRVEAQREEEIARIEADSAASAVADAAVAEAADQVAVERDHDQPFEERYRPERPGLAHRPGGVPEIMVLPEPEQNRPTVALPGQSASHRRGRMSPAELNVKLSRLEHSPFWLNEDERAAAANAWPTPATGHKPADSPPESESRRGVRPRRKPRTPKNAAPGVFGLIALALIASFFSWVSAEPFWLAVGHGTPGVATVARCTGSGVTQRCAGSFTATGGSFSKQTVSLLGVEPARRNPGAVAMARMVNSRSTQAYVGTTGPLVQLRWILGFVLVVLSGVGIAGLTGARQLETVRARRVAFLMSVAGPVLLLAGFLFTAY